MAPAPVADPASSSSGWTLARLLRAREREILAAWSARVRAELEGPGIDDDAMRDHVPEILRTLARCLEGADDRNDATCELEVLPDLHALERLQAGFDLETVAREYAALRSVIFDEWSAVAHRDVRARDVQRLDSAIDAAVTAAVAAYIDTRERTLRALDAITHAALSSQTTDLHSFLVMFIDRLRETMPSVDSAALYLVEDDHLVVHAAVGPAQAHAVGMRVRIGECLAGLAALEGAPVESVDASNDARISSPTIQRERLGAAYAVPLRVEGRVRGVAVVGSEHAREFSREDLVIVRLMASRAASLLALAESYLERERAAERERLAMRELTRATAIVERGDACFVLDKDWRVVLVNEQQERLSRMSREQTLGRVFWDVWPQTRGQLYWTEYHRARDERVLVHFEEYYAPLDLWTDVSAFPMPGGGIGVLFRDTSERKRMELKLREVVRELEEAVKLRERLLDIVSHDLRNPLNAISMSAAMLQRRDDLDERAARASTRIFTSAERARRMIGDLLDFAKARAGNLPITLDDVDLHELLSAVVEEVRHAWPGREVRLTTSGQGGARADADRLAQVITNVVGNALEHSPADKPVTVRSSGDDGHVTWRVHNGGAAIPADVVPQLFEPYARLSHPPPRATRGLGLGLYISRVIAEAHGGSIEVTSTAEAGTTVTVVLPRSPPP